VLGTVRPETTAHEGGGLAQQCSNNRPGFGLSARSTSQSGPTGPLGVARACSARSPRPQALWGSTVVRSVRPSRRTRSSSSGGISFFRAGGGAPGNVVGGGAHPSGNTAWRRWRMLRAVAFNSGEVAPVMDDIDGVALQCRGRREKVRGESI
jgi:hypothetical protein